MGPRLRGDDKVNRSPRCGTIFTDWSLHRCESEKAEREREQDEQRKSNEAKNEILSNPEQFLEYKRLKEKEMELLNTVPPSLTPYYKEKVNNYFNILNK